MVVYCPYAAREHMGLAACLSPEPGKDNLCRGTYQDRRTQRENGKQSFHNLHG